MVAPTHRPVPHCWRAPKSLVPLLKETLAVPSGVTWRMSSGVCAPCGPVNAQPGVQKSAAWMQIAVAPQGGLAEASAGAEADDDAAEPGAGARGGVGEVDDVGVEVAVDVAQDAGLPGHRAEILPPQGQGAEGAAGRVGQGDLDVALLAGGAVVELDDVSGDVAGVHAGDLAGFLRLQAEPGAPDSQPVAGVD